MVKYEERKKEQMVTTENRLDGESVRAVFVLQWEEQALVCIVLSM